jgi:glucose 1-dehydrogenase
MSGRLRGKHALITGASSGIGAATAVRFAREGASVVINHLGDDQEAERVRVQAERAAQAAGESIQVTIIRADVSDERQVQEMFAQAIKAFGWLDILVNNAGIQKRASSHEVEMDDFDRVVGVNLRGAFLCSREAIRHFLARRSGGVILNNSSVHEVIPKPFYVPYSISKGGMKNLTRTLALEYADRGIRVNAVGPGAIETPLNAAWVNDAKRRAAVERHIPMGRAGRPEEIAAVFAFLASDDASYITGQTIFACGGLTLYPEFRTAWASEGE